MYDENIITNYKTKYKGTAHALQKKTIKTEMHRKKNK